ncbi:hypothetical protein E3V36_00645 [Candidatus Marinimicrobia bacterium MT.SAG.2]|nr:hypothetical protein E3V36_00645 [Candidatus Marinimicrobia bacterium MT.SAG.2]
MNRPSKKSIKYIEHKQGIFDSYPVTMQQWKDIKSSIDLLNITGNIYQTILNGVIGLAIGLILSFWSFFLGSEVPDWLIIIYGILLGISISTTLILMHFMKDKNEVITNSKKRILSDMKSIEDGWKSR